jgi:hypothetical protein
MTDNRRPLSEDNWQKSENKCQSWEIRYRRRMFQQEANPVSDSGADFYTVDRKLKTIFESDIKPFE